MASTWAAKAARQAITSARLSSTSSAAQAVQRRGFAGAADHHGPPKVACWKDPVSPSNWKEEHLDSLGDIFDSSLNLEETHFDEGFEEGYNDGLASGNEEGRQVGLKHGFETGEELGLYRGCIDVWTSAIRVNPNCFSTRIQKNIKTLDELLKKYPVLDPENESLNEIMESLRLKFRSISATLNVKLEYNGYHPKALDANLY